MSRGPGVLRLVAIVSAVVVSGAVVLSLPTSGQVIVGGRARALALPAEPDVVNPGTYLLMTAHVRPKRLAEALLDQSGVDLAWSRPLDQARGGGARSAQTEMGEAKVAAWQAALRTAGSSFVVAGVDPGSPAERAGLQPQDVLSESAGRTFDLQRLSDRLDTGLVTTVRVVRDGVPLNLTIDPGPDGVGGLGGVILSGSSTLTLPPPLDTGSAEGPSAGLVLALADLDLLTGGDLTSGHTIAVTGAITPWGDVLGVAGYREKLQAAAQANAEVILVPAIDVAAIREIAPDGLSVIAVSTLDEAVRELCELGARNSVCSEPPRHMW